MLQSRAAEGIVGAFIAVGLGALLVLALQVSNLTLASLDGDAGYEIRAQFDNIGGLKVRSPVKMAGVTVGRVKAIELDRSTLTAVAVMRIGSEYNAIPADTIANIYTAGLLGEQYVGLEPGGSDETLKAGDVITQTQSAVVLEQMIGRLLYSKAAGEEEE
jgi:phospholipid/cholesterol/gamma-HCH transport system substrate-binding protein